MNINELVSEKIKSLDVDAVFNEKLEKLIGDTVEQALKNQVGSYSTLSKALEEAFEKSLDLKLSNLPLSTYSNFIVENACSVIEEAMSEEKAEVIKLKFREKMNLVSKKEISFEELVENLENILLKMIEGEDDCCNPASYEIRSIVDSADEHEYRSADYFKLQVCRSGASSDWDGVVLCLDDKGLCYHSNKERYEFKEISRIFNALVFNRALVKEFDTDYSRKLSYDDLI